MSYIGNQSTLSLLYKDDDYLYHMPGFVQSLDGLPLCQFEEADLGWDEPSKKVSEDYIVAKRDDVLDLPKDGSAVSMIVVSERNVLCGDDIWIGKEALDMFEEPGLEPATNFIELA